MTGRQTATARRAAGLGIETSYVGVDGARHTASPSTVELVLEILSADAPPSGEIVPPVHVVTPGDPGVPVAAAVTRPASARLDLEDGGGHDLVLAGGRLALPALPVGVHTLHVEHPSEPATTVLVPPPAMPRSRRLEGGVGLFVPAYALWSEREPMPSIGHLADLSATVQSLGVDVVATLPLYAAFLDQPFEPSPYSPASRLHWNEAYIDSASLPGTPGPVDRAAISDGDMIGWREVGRIRRNQLVDAAGTLDDATAAALARWTAAHPDVAGYARFRAGLDGDRSARVLRSHELGQFLIEGALRALRTGPGAGLALDLPIGCHPRGYETWAHPEQFAPGIAVGAPPDDFFTGGQNWGFPPLLPGASRRSGHRLWRETVTRAAEMAPMLRIDHVMAVHRLWWIPDGNEASDGVYVRYPADELLAVIAIAADRAATTVVGEDLGTVPPVVRRLMDGVGMLGMHEEQFAVIAGEAPGHPGPDTVAGVRTHDMPAFASVARGPGADRYATRLGLDPGCGPGPLLDAVLGGLAGSDAYMVMVDLDDLLDETRPHNVPGTTDGGAWRRRLTRPVDDVLGDPAVQDRLRAVATTREEARS